MEFFFELIFELFGELLLQLLFESLAEIGFHSMAGVFKKPKHPAAAAFGYLLWGAVAGGLSLLIFPSSFIHTQSIKIINLIVTPIMMGGIMVLIGKLREKRGQETVELDRFAYGFLFALGMALVRFIWA